MLRALIFFAAAAIAIWGVYILSGVNAPVTLTWGDRIFGPHAPFEAVVAATVLLVIALVFWNFLAWIFWRKPKDIVEGIGRKRREAGYQALTKGLMSLATGDTREAARQQVRAEARLHEDNPLNRMLSAEIAQKNGDDEAAIAQFEAMSESAETRFLGLQGLYRQARKQGNMGQALAILEDANKAKPGTPWVLDALFRVQSLSGRWEGARDSLNQLQKRKLVDDDQAKHWRAVVDVEASRERAANDEGKEALALAKEAYKAHPSFAPAAIQYADMETRYGRNGRADKVIYDVWSSNPHPDLVPIYEKVTSIFDRKKIYEKFKNLAISNPIHPETKIMMAREAVRMGDFEEAKAQLTALAKLDPDARVCRLMADIELASGGDRAIARDWLARASVAPPDHVWVCRESGAVATQWSPISPTGHFDSMDWRRPSYVPLTELPNPVDPITLLDSPEVAMQNCKPVETVDIEFLPAPNSVDATATNKAPAVEPAKTA